MTDEKPPAGWYEYDDGEERYWDGERWTDQRRKSAARLTLTFPRGVLIVAGILAVVAGIVVVALIVTGDDGGGGASDELSLDERLKITNAESAFYDTILDGSRYGATLNGVGNVIAICRTKPDAITTTFLNTRGGPQRKVTMRQLLEDWANEFREYQPDIAADLDNVADSGCR